MQERYIYKRQKRLTQKTMNTRRAFLRTSAFSLVGITSQIVSAAPRTPQHPAGSRRGYALTNGATALKRDDGAWLFWVRIINVDGPTHDIYANLQIATDRSFSQVIDAIPVTLTQSKSFIAQPVYAPKTKNTQLYYRYVIDSSPTVAPSVSSIVNSIAPWNTESKAE
ncbi:hypothetical protein P0D88_36650 [Paraburkholderia sp. RL18-103-BIB-C]|uniref:hypothetical protein n=1 Tax=unclassified Paraburkholderia TaxID=2615204 RepID=UPI0038BCD82C